MAKSLLALGSRHQRRLYSSTSKLTHHGIHVLQCPDQVGIVARISDCISGHGANITSTDIFVDMDSRDEPVFNSRCQFSFNPVQWTREEMESSFQEIGKQFVGKSVVSVPGMDRDMKVAVFASLQDHCLVNLLHRWQDGMLPVQIECVISNHARGEDTHIWRFLKRHGIPYHYLPTTKANKREDDILELVSGTDFLVLARYMQILSGDFIARYGKDIINIHHGLLPSFKGANPYRQAYEAGVKLIGATTHFVCEELDAGPIIEQMVERVSHRDTLESFAMKSESLERQCLDRAIKYYCEQRILRYGRDKTKTIVFA
ncbi:hypothetical protein SELMODRAFT_98865 [Selaginella moellendorffii]|uniref:ACT domain-containing protein n=1 Tax=Selaginella moellendorffii TaxID=88036 RepID=D8RPX9_SELML|nr:formyltetrahydrofolate deformylase 2, mitochondrial [Selaginella moellendorffii]EFJ25559.1 hypothetical protein SELMODRAFT_98865 [Selaginella moellendorffii]|eukprot:XP_002973185.1 formyltetrahydrofolate deformylase 2, mitochondrial [Selaginella moellendorffii]